MLTGTFQTEVKYATVKKYKLQKLSSFKHRSNLGCFEVE
jgi:hypothetical protein